MTRPPPDDPQNVFGRLIVTRAIEASAACQRASEHATAGAWSKAADALRAAARALDAAADETEAIGDRKAVH